MSTQQRIAWMARFNRSGIVHAFLPAEAQTSVCGVVQRQDASGANAARDPRRCKRCDAGLAHLDGAVE